MDEKRVNAGIGVVLFKDGKILMGHRSDKQIDPNVPLQEAGTWTLPMAKLEYGEEFEQAASRALLHETGVSARKLKVFCVNNDHLNNAHFVTVGVVCEDWNGEPKTSHPEKIMRWEWFDLEEPPFPIFMPSAKILLNLRKNKVYFSN
jgi:8-oxo-dGTP diphosphatase